MTDEPTWPEVRREVWRQHWRRTLVKPIPLMLIFVGGGIAMSLLFGRRDAWMTVWFALTSVGVYLIGMLLTWLTLAVRRWRKLQ